MKSQLSNKRIIIVLILCILAAICFVSCNDEKLKEESISVEIASKSPNDDKDKTSEIIKKERKESEKNDLTVKRDSDKESEVITKAEKEKEGVAEEHISTDKKDIKPAAKPEKRPVVKQETKPEPEEVIKPAPEKKKIWVVDQEAIPAWDEVVDDYDFPIGYDREYYWIKGSGISERYYSGKELNKRLDEFADKGIEVSWGNGSEFIQTGYMKKTIHHAAVPEKGHWEWK